MLNIKEHKDGYQVFVKTKPIKTPQQFDVVVPTKALADLVCTNNEVIKLINTAIDHISTKHDHFIEKITNKIHTDLLCYRTESPESLVKKQEELWDPLLAKFTDKFGLFLKTTTGLCPVNQSADTVCKLKDYLNGLSEWQLVGLAEGAGLYDSLVITLLLANNYVESELLWEAAILDELYQTQKWGDDSELAKSLESRKSDHILLKSFFNSIR